jgi:hypothetical protein
MTNETKQTMNRVDCEADKLIAISMRTEGPAGEILKHYAERLMKLATETYTALKKCEPVVFPERHPELRSLSEIDAEKNC